MKNIYLIYLLSFLHKSWLWLGIWVLYYLRYTDYSGLGLLESVMIITSTTTEIPTGAVGDLLGKKKTLFLAFSLSAIGNLIMSVAPNFLVLSGSIIAMTIGGSFYSGTMEALVYDSLKEKNQENIFDKVMANIATVQLIAFALASILGGYLYAIKPSLPFMILGIVHAVGAIIAIFIKEPAVDTEIFSLNNYISQTKQGFKELFKTADIGKQTLLLLALCLFSVIAFEVLNDVLLVEFKFSEKQLGLIAAVIYLTSAGIAQLAPIIGRKLKPKKSAVVSGGIIALSFVASPFVNMIFGGLTVLLRNAGQIVLENNVSVLVNRSTDSKYRATTISTFEMIKKLPYVLTAFFIGRVMDLWSGKTFAFWLGIIMLAVLIIVISKLTKPLKSAGTLLAHNR